MRKIKTILLMIVIIGFCGLPFQLVAQNIIWVESAFEAPRLVKTAADRSQLLSQSLPAGSLPQSIVFNTNESSFYWSGLSYINAGINKVSSDFSVSSEIVKSQSVLRGMAVDPLNKKIYWISTNLVNGPKIWRADLDGQSPKVLIDFGPASNNTPRAISLDVDAGKMYWTNFGAGKIQRADLQVGALQEDILGGLNGPSGLALDMDSGKMYWTEMNGGKIKSADLNGANDTVLVQNLSSPNSIAINRQLSKMAWTEMGSGKVKSAALDGSNIFDYNVSASAPTAILIEAPIEPSGDLVVIPADTTIQVQNYVQFKSQLVDSFGNYYNISASWDVTRRLVGPITQDGLIFSYFPGKANVMAKADSMVAKASLTGVDTTIDSSGTNKIKFVRIFPNGNVRNPKTIDEGKKYVLGGLPDPFNIINGTMLYFPKGSLHEDITIEIRLPEFAKLHGDSIEFIEKVVNGIQFDVFVGDSLISPYYFDKPVSIALPFKRGIVKRLGIRVEDLGLFYATDSLSFDSLGVSHVMVDSSDNRIYGLVEHFSTLVVRENLVVSSSKADDEKNTAPSNFELKQNYPNPFNPITVINYQIPKQSEVELSIFNTLGQKVATLVTENQAAGTYNVTWNASGFASGIYLYKIETSGGFSQTKKLILLK
ncbi:MAG: T9SS C-terminal target domain-containing protein [Calditrichaeota bacterium]|nr:MAG: T9SS C-terminal target domain-containing protein [Calditrichota bacterium]MBL1208134.1 T9SS C-terminal target domain-containing protein [Calditrichota bacterium]NOG47972.1 T9SS type A sorting domain-containing protein [Calditrichota bacterium]